MKLAFSTAWADGNMDRVCAVLPHIDSLEIGSKGDGRFFQELEDLVRKENVPVTSVHAIAYPGKSVQDADYAPRLASLDRQLRRREIDEMSSTAEWALGIGARALVIHTGKIEDDELKEMYLDYKQSALIGMPSEALEEQFEEIVRRREELSKPHVESIIEVLDILCPRYAELDFSIETRVNYYEIPLPDELEFIFQEVSYPNLGYWHDIGHTCVLDRLGFVPMNTWQQRFAHRCHGAHVHDMDRSLLDHYPPGEGVLDIHCLLEQFGPGVLLTLEINARNDFESVMRGIHYLRADRIRV